MCAQLISSELETNPHNHNGTCLALYFDREPTAVEVTKAAIGVRKYDIGLYEEEAEYEIVPSVLSKRSKLVRALVFNIG